MRIKADNNREAIYTIITSYRGIGYEFGGSSKFIVEFPSMSHAACFAGIVDDDDDSHNGLLPLVRNLRMYTPESTMTFNDLVTVTFELIED